MPSRTIESRSRTPTARAAVAVHPPHAGLTSTVAAELSLLAPLRILANFSVVAHHMRGGDLFFGVRFGMFLFLALMFALNASSRRSETLLSFGARKFGSLLAPWLRWSLVYAALALAMGVLREGDAGARLGVWMLTAGGHASLWFLPFAFTALLVWRLVAPWLDGIDPLRIALVAAPLGLGTLVAASLRLEASLPPLPWDAWLRAAPLVLWGIAIGQARRLAGVRRRFVLLFVPALAVMGWACEPLIQFHEDMGRRVAVVMILLAFGLAVSPRLPRVFAFVGTLTYGIYLAHPLVAKVLAEVADPFAWNVWVHALVVWTISAVLVHALRRLGIRGAEIQRRPSP